MTPINEIEIARLPTLPLAERESLPECAAVYFAVAPGGQVLYVGQTVCLLARWRAHHRIDQLADSTSIAWLVVDDVAALADMERQLIRRFRPSLNWLRHTGPTEEGSTIAVRVPIGVREYYERQAKAERRRLSDVVRILLVDHARRQIEAA